MAIIRRKKNSKSLFRIAFLLLLIIFAFQFDNIGRKIYPFPYREMVITEATANNIDPYLLAAIIKTESNFNPNATSSAGAKGLLQIMPETGYWIAAQMGLQNFEPNQLYSPEKSIIMGAWYWANLKKEFNGEQALTIAAYNAGRGNVKEWLDKQHWTGEEKTVEQIPFPETRYYIRKVMWNYKVYHYLYDDTKN